MWQKLRKLKGTVSICRPTTLQGLFDLKAKYNDAKLIVGNTEVGIEMKFKSMAYPHLVGVTHIAELNRIEVGFRYTLRMEISSHYLSQIWRLCHFDQTHEYVGSAGKGKT